MFGLEYFHGGWLWATPFMFMAVMCFLMMRGGKMSKGMGCMHSMSGERSGGHDHGRNDAESPIDLAASRYAAGEIGKEEYDSIVNRLTGK